MYVKMLNGKFTGEVKDLRSDVALEFIRRGEAERAFQDPPAVVAVAPPTSQASAEEPLAHGKRHRVRR